MKTTRSRPDMIGNKLRQGKEPWNKGTKGLVKPNRTSFVSGSKGHMGYTHNEKTKQSISEAKKGVPIGPRNPRWNQKRHSTEQAECACGCGTMITKWDKRGRRMRYVLGHHLAGKARPDVSERLREAWANGEINPAKGDRHGMWKGGRTPFLQLLRHAPEYNAWRHAVYARDLWHCQECGKHCGRRDIVAHHIKSFKDYPELRYEVDNGMTLCRKCHMARERSVIVAS